MGVVAGVEQARYKVRRLAGVLTRYLPGALPDFFLADDLLAVLSPDLRYFLLLMLVYQFLDVL